MVGLGGCPSYLNLSFPHLHSGGQWWPLPCKGLGAVRDEDTCADVLRDSGGPLNRQPRTVAHSAESPRPSVYQGGGCPACPLPPLEDQPGGGRVGTCQILTLSHRPVIVKFSVAVARGGGGQGCGHSEALPTSCSPGKPG